VSSAHIISSRSHLQQNGKPMKFISICDRTGIVECEIFADAYHTFGLATVRYPVVQVTGVVKLFDNSQGFTRQVLRVEKVRTEPWRLWIKVSRSAGIGAVDSSA
jgi:DNA polymerase III alpha subunit